MDEDSEGYRSVGFSRTTMVKLMVPGYANFGGKVHGGILLGLMDEVAYTCAAKHSGGYCVTVSVDEVDFRAPVEVGDLVALAASINYVGKSSMQIGIKVTAENVRTGLVRHTNTSYFTMVAKSDDGVPMRVPGLILETREDVRRYIEAIKRLDLKAEHRAQLDNARTRISVDTEMQLLEGRRCRVAPSVAE